jgi:perosamine synthetase
VYNDIEYKKGLCPVAESIQPKLMQFKTNYRSLELAEIKAQALKKTIKHFKEKK